MLNIEKYKEDILNMRRASITCCASDLSHVGCCANKSCIECKKEALEWLLEEYTEPILDDKEREYLSSVIEPFRKSVISIKKLEATYGWEIISFYYTFQSYGCITILPPFQSGTRFKNMELGKEYTCEELGL
nr:MAG TPA: hypothetical protein [Caudoviricetes sp.]